MTSKSIRDIKCQYVYDDEIFIKREGVNKVVCTSDGRVIEMYDDNVLATCELQRKNPSRVSVFYGYDPFVKYYIVSYGKTLVVLHKQDENLKMFRSYENVQKYQIADFLVIGKPQVKIWFLDEMEPFITDFSCNNLCNLNDRKEMQRMSDLNRKLHLMRLSLNGINKVSEGRKQMQENYFKQLHVDESLLVLHQEPWQRIVNGRWVICVPVKNNYDSLVNNVQLLLISKLTCEVETKILNPSLNTIQFLSKNELSPQCHSYAFGIIDLPNIYYLKEDINFTFSLLYNISNCGSDNCIKELRIPPFMFNIKNFVNRSIDIFISNDNDLSQDIITCIAISEAIVLELRFMNSKDITQVIDVLKNELKLIEYQIFETQCYVVKPNCTSMLRGLVVFIQNVSETVYSFVCYPKDIHQVELFKSFVQIFFKDELISMRKWKSDSSYGTEGSILAAVNALDDEFKHFMTVVRSAVPTSSSLPLKEENNLKFTVEMWKGLIESTLPLDTDIQFQNVAKGTSDVNLCTK